MVEPTGIYVIEGHDISFYPSAEDAVANVEGYDAAVYDYLGTDGSVWRATVEGPAWGPVTLHPTSETRPDLVAQLRAAGYQVNSSD